VHNVDGSLQSTTYPSGYYIYNGYDQAQRTNFVGDLASPGVSYIDDATYTPSGLLTGSHGADTGNGPLITNSLSYNNRLQPTSISGATTSNTIFSLSYAYGPTGQNNGNISIYQAILKQKPDAKAKQLDDLLKKQSQGKLNDALKQCP
jgi:hypothetical protein